MPSNEGKTEKPTPRRLEKAREKGQVPQSSEALSAATLIILTIATALAGPSLVNWTKKQIVQSLSCDTAAIQNAQAFNAFACEKIIQSLLICLPFLAALAAGGIAVTLLVSGPTLAPKALQWKFTELNPINGIKQLFSTESLVKLLLSVLKLVFIGLIVWFYIREKLDYLATLQWMPVQKLLAAISSLIAGAVIRICAGLLVIALADWAYRKWRYTEQLKMTKQEVRDEYRDTEGPPEIKSRLRRKQFELGMRRMLTKVPKASVVLVNPDHVAVALQYQPGQTSAPVVIAKGADLICEKIKEIARAYGVPIIRRPALAREIFATVKIDKPIPEKLFTVVAEVLALIHRLRTAK